MRMVHIAGHRAQPHLEKKSFVSKRLISMEGFWIVVLLLLVNKINYS